MNHKMNTYSVGSIPPDLFQQLTFAYVWSIIRSIESGQNLPNALRSKHISKFCRKYFRANSITKSIPMEEIRMLSMKSICEKLDCHKSKIHRLRREDKFPVPMVWGGQVRWLESEIDDYINGWERA